jgi:peptidyl-prolyl cis-trans isomerase D
MKVVMPPTQTPASKKHVAHLAKVRRQTQIIKYVTIGVFVVVIAILLGGLIYNAGFPPYQNVARANGENLSADEFKARVKLERIKLINQYQQIYYMAQFYGVDPATDPNFASQVQQIQLQLAPATKTLLGQQTIDTWVGEVVLRKKAKELGITISDEELQKFIQEQGFGFYPNGTPTPEPTATTVTLPTINPTELAIVTITPTASPEPTFTPGPTETPTQTPTSGPAPTSEPTFTPEPSATPYTLEGYNQRYAEILAQYQKDSGVTEEQFKQIFFVNPLLRKKVLDAMTVDMKPVQEQLWARHILVATEADALAVIDRLNKGEDWSKIAAEVSQDTSNKDRGGDLGWFGRGVMVQAFDDAAFAMQPGEISQPVKTDFGYHIIQVIGREERPLDATQFETARQKVFSDWLQGAIKEVKVKTYNFWMNIVPTEPTLQ